MYKLAKLLLPSNFSVATFFNKAHHYDNLTGTTLHPHWKC